MKNSYFEKFIVYAKEHGVKKAFKRSFEKLKEIGFIKGVIKPDEVPSGKWGNMFGVDEAGSLIFQCNICGSICKSKVPELKREKPSCRRCGSTVRTRAIIHILSNKLFGKSLSIRDFPERKDITGIGMSDWEGYAVPLKSKLNYTNTYYHKEPRLDITSIDPLLEGTLDFIISSDVFEHIEPPVSHAFENARRLLKPNGIFIFTAPYTKEVETKEHFPDLYKYEIVKMGNNLVLKNITKEGKDQIYDNLRFHGGDGATLEMRVFSELSLLEEFSKAGFGSVEIYRKPDFNHGIYWSNDWSLPVVARIGQECSSPQQTA